MQIPQYDKRIIANTAERTKLNIKEPEALRDTSHLKRQAKQFSDATAEYGDTFLDMKKQRDLGIVNQFMNDYEVEKVKKISELKNTYKGSNANGMIDAFHMWQNEYMANRIGYSQATPDGTLYLENQEQIDEVQKQMSSNMATSINSLSSYVASELNTFNEQQADGRIFQLTEAISKDNDLNNVANFSQQIAYLMGQRYPDSPMEYKEMQTKKLLDAAYNSSIDRMITENPVQAMMTLQTGLYQNNMSAGNITSRKQAAISALIDRDSSRVAELNAQGANVMTTISPDEYEMIKPIIAEYGEDVFKAQVIQKAKEKETTLVKGLNDAKNERLNTQASQAYSLMSIINNPYADSNTKSNVQNSLANLTGEMKKDLDGSILAANLIEMNDGVNKYKALDNSIRAARSSGIIYKNDDARNDYMQKLDEFNVEKQVILSQSIQMDEIFDRIDKGDYSNYSDLITQDLHPVNKAKVFDKLASVQKYRDFENRAMKNGYKVDDVISKSYKSVTGSEASNTLPVYSLFKKYMKDELLSYYSINGKYPDEITASGLAASARANMYKSEKGLAPLIQISEGIPAIRSKLSKSSKFISYDDLIENIASQMSDDAFDNLSDEDKKEVANLLISNKLMGAYSYIKESQND